MYKIPIVKPQLHIQCIVIPIVYTHIWSNMVKTYRLLINYYHMTGGNSTSIHQQKNQNWKLSFIVNSCYVAIENHHFKRWPALGTVFFFSPHGDDGILWGSQKPMRRLGNHGFLPWVFNGISPKKVVIYWDLMGFTWPGNVYITNWKDPPCY